jgi:hypothetical protein
VKRLALLASLVAAAALAPVANASIDVAITSPSSGDHSLSGVVPVQVSASSDKGIYGVQLYVDGKPYGSVEQSPSALYSYSVAWDTSGVPAGTHTLTANAIDWSQLGGGAQQQSAPVTVDVGPAYPTVALTKPAGWTFVRGNVDLGVDVTSVGTTSVKYTVDGATVATAGAAPFAGTWSSKSVADGSRTVAAIVTDGRGKQSTSSVNVTVDNTAPSVALQKPQPGALSSGTLAVSAHASDAYGVASVQFVVDGKAAGAALTQPDGGSGYVYSATLDISGLASVSTHQVTAVATDAAGNTATAASVSFAIDTTKPTAVLYQPAAGARLDGVTTLQVHASDANGVRSVQFTVDGAPFGAVLTKPDAGQSYLYSLALDTTTLARGTHTIAATATDQAGNVGVTASVSIKTGPLQFLPVLNYHEIQPAGSGAIYDQTPTEADQQLAYLKANGYQSVTLEQYQKWLGGADIGVAKPVLITVDDGLKTEQAWDALLAKYGFKAVMFVITGYAENKTPGDKDDNNMSWGDVKKLAANGRWQIAFHAGELGHGDSYATDASAAIDIGHGSKLTFSTSCPYFYTCLGIVTTGDPKKGNKRAETFAEYQARVTAEVAEGTKDLQSQVKGASPLAWAAPFNVAGQWTNLYNDPSGQAQQWFPAFMASKFQLVFTQTNPITYGQASGTVGSLTGFNRYYRFEVHTATTLQEFTQALADPAFAR